MTKNWIGHLKQDAKILNRTIREFHLLHLFRSGLHLKSNTGVTMAGIGSLRQRFLRSFPRRNAIRCFT